MKRYVCFFWSLESLQSLKSLSLCFVVPTDVRYCCVSLAYRELQFLATSITNLWEHLLNFPSTMWVSLRVSWLPAVDPTIFSFQSLLILGTGKLVGCFGLTSDQTSIVHTGWRKKRLLQSTTWLSSMSYVAKTVTKLPIYYSIPLFNFHGSQLRR